MKQNYHQILDFHRAKDEKVKITKEMRAQEAQSFLDVLLAVRLPAAIYNPAALQGMLFSDAVLRELSTHAAAEEDSEDAALAEPAMQNLMEEEQTDNDDDQD